MTFEGYFFNAPPEMYLKMKQRPGDPIKPLEIKIAGKTKDHLEYYAWRREIVWKIDGILSYPETVYRLLAKPQGFPDGKYIVTSAIVRRILRLVATEDGSIYTLGIELHPKDCRLKCGSEISLS